MACGWKCEVSEAALVSAVALLGWLLLIWRSGALRDVGGDRKLGLAAAWMTIFVVSALLFQIIR